MRDPDALLAMAEEGVKAALGLGAEDAEIYAQEVEVAKVAASGRLVSPASSNEIALGVRVALGGRAGVSGASSPAGLEVAIREAIESVAGVAAAKERFAFPAPAAQPSRLAPARWVEDPEGQADFAAQLVESALRDPRVTFIECKVVAARRRIAIASSLGVRGWDETTSHRVELELRCSRGTTHRAGRDFALLDAPVQSRVDPVGLVGEAVARVGSALDAEPLAGGPVQEAIFLPACGSQVVAMAAGALAPRRGTASPLGERRYAEAVTLTDDARGPAGVKRRVVDDEGAPTRSLALVREGRVEGSLQHGMRVAPSAGVSARPVNLALASGARSLDDVLADVERAVILPEPFLGGFTSNKATGDFSVVVPYAFLVEGGKVRHALGPTTVGGNAQRVLASVREVAREAKACASAVAPPFLAGGVSCAT